MVISYSLWAGLCQNSCHVTEIVAETVKKAGFRISRKLVNKISRVCRALS